MTADFEAGFHIATMIAGPGAGKQQLQVRELQ